LRPRGVVVEVEQKEDHYCRHPFQVQVGSVLLRGEAFIPSNEIYEKPEPPTLVLCHGIPGGKASSGKRKKGYDYWARFLARKGYPVVIFNFRGTGESDGNLNLREWPGDLQAILNYYDQKVRPGNSGLVLVGFSAGGAASVEIAADDLRVKAVVLAACPADFNFFLEWYTLEKALEWMKDTGLFRDPHYPPDPNQWLEDFLSLRAEEKIHRLTPRPLLLLHGELDELVPVDHAYRLYRKAEHPKQIKTFPGLGHRLRLYPRVFGTMLNWLKEI